MSMIVRSDEAVIPFARETVFDALLDFKRYSEWWPAPLRVRMVDAGPPRVGTVLRIRNTPFFRWLATIVEIRRGELIRFVYSGRLVRGHASWVLEDRGDRTMVSYRVDIELIPRWLRFAARWFDMAAEHSRQIRRILGALERHLADSTAIRP